MKWILRKCPACKLYTLKQNCSKCGVATVTPHPPRFSPHDKYAKLRQPRKDSEPQ